MRLMKWIFWVLILLILAVFVAINMKSVAVVELDPFRLGYEWLSAVRLPLPFLIAIVLGVGLVVGIMLENSRARDVRRELRREQRRRGELETEIKRLQATLKASDHPDSAGLPVARR